MGRRATWKADGAALIGKKNEKRKKTKKKANLATKTKKKKKKKKKKMKKEEEEKEMNMSTTAKIVGAPFGGAVLSTMSIGMSNPFFAPRALSTRGSSSRSFVAAGTADAVERARLRVKKKLA